MTLGLAPMETEWLFRVAFGKFYLDWWVERKRDWGRVEVTPSGFDIGVHWLAMDLGEDWGRVTRDLFLWSIGFEFLFI